MNRDSKTILNIYRELYANSEPKGDFDKLLKDATVDIDNHKIIPFNDYEITIEKYDKILEKHLSKYKRTYKKQQIKNTIALGCSPRFKS